MRQRDQEKAFEGELHALCTRYFDEWDIKPESMLEILESEKVFILSIMLSREEEDDDDDEQWRT